MVASPLAQRRCLVLGVSGFLGRSVARELVSREAEVIVQVRSTTRLPRDLAAAGLRAHEADLSERGSARALVQAVQPDLVFNLVGYGVAKNERAEAGYERLNVELVAELAEALRASPSASGVRLIHVGSALEFGRAATSLDEREPCMPDTAYGRSKLRATTLLDDARLDGLAALTARAFTVFGLGERPGRLVPTLIAARGSSERIPLSDGFQQRDWIYVEDAARALVELGLCDDEAVRTHRPPFDAPALNLASGRLHSVRAFVQLCAQHLGLEPQRLGFGDVPELAEELHHPEVPVARLQAALGWTPPPTPASGLARLAERLGAGAEA